MHDDPTDFDPPLRIRAGSGAPIASVDDWRHLAAPAGGDKGWKVGRSAYELANAWVGGDAPAIPDGLVALLESAPRTASFAPGLARPEAKIQLDDFRGNTRNADLLLHGTSHGVRTLVTVEAKADEPFGRTIGDEVQGVADKPASNLPKRISALSALLFGEGVDAGSVRYQLVHGLAATVLQAQRRDADQAIFVIHQFRTSETVDAKIETNHDDLRSFLTHLGVDDVAPGQLQGVEIPGAPGLPVFVGLITTDTTG